MILFWFQIGFGLFVILILIALGIKTLKEKIPINDEKIIQIVREKLLQDGYDYFELESIISLGPKQTTSVIANVGYQEIALEIDNTSGSVVSSERIAK
jgi:hypothetical protein